MSDTWKITVEPQALTIPTGETGRVAFTITNQGASPRLADLEIVPDPGAAHPSWFTIDAPAVVLPGRSVAVAVQVKPRVAALGHSEQYTFGFRGRVESAVGGDVSVTVAGPARWQVTVSPAQLEVTSPGGYLVVYTVTNLVAEAATAVLEAPYRDPNMVWWPPGIQYHLEESQKLIPGFASAAFTLRIDNPSFITVDADETVQGRVTTAGGGDLVLCPPVSIHYGVETITKPSWVKVAETGEWTLLEPPQNGLS